MGAMVGEPELDREALRARAERALEFAARQLHRTRADWPPQRPAPVHTRGGRWHRPQSLWTDWTPGFYAGQMWILARLTGEAGWRAAAEEHTRPLKDRRFDRDVHDLGFIFLSTYRRWHDLLAPGDPLRQLLADVLVTAGTVQSFRYREGPGGEDGFVYSFNGPQSLFIDTLMNVRLLFWAGRHGAPPEVGRRALAHARSSLRHLVRRDGPGLGEEDGSVAHEAIFNAEPGRGEFRCLSTQQGYSPFTCWSRGLAWAIYGFAEAHSESGDPQLLEAAESCAGFYLRRTPADGVPFWDYGAPNIPTEPLDSSAAAITACGLMVLAGLVPPERAETYRRAARRILETLLSERFLAEGHPGEEGLLLHGTYHRPRGWGVDASVMWGDYFFLEALEKTRDSA
jgi:unsaturated chondroitin disaccharide hydrolase